MYSKASRIPTEYHCYTMKFLSWRLYCIVKKKVTTSTSSFGSLNGTLNLGCDSSYNETKAVSKEQKSYARKELIATFYLGVSN